jgi:hypothetical protein
MGNRWLIALLTLCASAVVHAQDPKSCSESSELECIHSPHCTLVQTVEHGAYTCRAARGRCEIGFRQAGEGDIRADCEAKPGCEFKPASCFCPPNVQCVCGGGPPAQCVERGKSG